MPFVLLEQDMTPEAIAAFLRASATGDSTALAEASKLAMNSKRKVEELDNEDDDDDTEVISNSSEGSDNKDKEPPVYAPNGSIGEAKNLYQGPRDEYGKATWTAEYPKNLKEPPENAESKQYALLIRHTKCYDGRKKLKIDSLVVQSPGLKRILGQVLKNYPGISSTELDRLEFTPPFEPFVHRWEKLTAARDAEQDPETKKHLDLLYEVLEKELGDDIKDKNDLFAHGVARYSSIWTLFEPGVKVFTHSDEGHERIYRFKRGDFRANNRDGPHYSLECQYVDFDGQKFGYGQENVVIRQFSGTVPISKLPALPIDYHPNKDELLERIMARGKLFEEYQGYHFKHYEGIGLGWGMCGLIRYSINSRVIIDTYAYNRFNPNRAIHLSPMREESGSNCNDNKDDYNEDDYDSQCDDSEYEFHNSNGAPACKRQKLNDKLTDEQRLIATHELRGYALKDKKWLIFSIPSVKPITWNEDAFASLVAPEEQKELILAFARSQMKHKDSFDDVIQGKGRGIIMLLSGPPGVGKTLTAESVSETMKVPLYTMSAGDLGTAPHEVETKLSNILEMNTKWNAVLLLDEADVFLEARSSHDLERNKLVSIFLRLLEYYEGILFLTTNRVENIDAAFESRIHLSLQYDNLDKESRAHVWRTFLGRVAGADAFTEANIEGLAEYEMNGRQIKNVLKASQLLASERGTPLGFADVRTVMKVRVANELKMGQYGALLEAH